MEDNDVLLSLVNVLPKTEVKEEEELEEEVQFKLETITDIDEKLDVLKPVVVLDLVAFKSKYYNVNASLKEEIAQDDLVKIKEENISDDDIDDKDLELFKLEDHDPWLKSENVHSDVELKKEEEELDEQDGEEPPTFERDDIFIINQKTSVSTRKTPTKTTRKKYIRERKFLCDHCGKKFTQSDVLRRHIRVHTGERPYVCSFCSKTFRTKHLLKNHSQLHTGKRFKCTYCEKEFQQNHQLKLHLLNHTGNKPVFTCDMCKRTYSRIYLLNRHISEFHLGNPRKVVNSDHSRQQKNLVGPKLDQRVTCIECNKELSCKKNLKIHWIRRHQTTKEFPYTCYHCDKTFPEKHNLKIHINHTHLQTVQVKCQYCNKTFKSDHYLQIHINNYHESDKSTEYFCDICDMVFWKIHYLKRHKLIHTEETKNLICDTCGYRCRYKSEMAFHVIKHMETVPKPFKCGKCKMAFVKATKLRRHELVHSNIRPHACQQCDKTYKDAQSLKIHENAVHLNMRYSCYTCGFQSINKNSFRRHIRLNKCSKKLLKLQKKHGSKVV